MTVKYSRERIESAVFAALSDALAVPTTQLSNKTRIVEDLGADSMSILTALITIEDALDIEVDISDLPEGDATIESIIDRLIARIDA